MAALREAGLITSRTGRRAGARRPVGRLIDVGLHAPCKALAPDGFDVGNLWALARSLRARPAALVTAMVGAYMLACDAAERRREPGDPALTGLEEWGELGCPLASWRRFIGHRDNASWTKRVRELVGLGLLRREGSTVFVAPPRAWFMLAVDHAETKIAGRIDKARAAVEEVEEQPAVQALARAELPDGRMARVGRARPTEVRLDTTGTGGPRSRLAQDRGPP